MWSLMLQVEPICILSYDSKKMIKKVSLNTPENDQNDDIECVCHKRMVLEVVSYLDTPNDSFIISII